MEYGIELLQKNCIPYDWVTIYVGIKLKLLNLSDASKYAIEYIENNDVIKNDFILQLAWGTEGLLKEEFFQRINEEFYENIIEENSPKWELEVRKIRYCILKELEKEIFDFDSLFREITRVYESLNCPEDMDEIIPYMPPKNGYNPLNHLDEENSDRLLNLFRCFLVKEEREIRKNSYK